MSRRELPNRRHQMTERVTWSSKDGAWESKAYVSVGIDPTDITACEVFIRGAGKQGSERDFLMDDIAVVLSRALQHGDRLEALAAGMGRTPDGKPTSLLGAVIEGARRMEIETMGAGPTRVPRPGNIIPLPEQLEVVGFGDD